MPFKKIEIDVTICSQPIVKETNINLLLTECGADRGGQVFCSCCNIGENVAVRLPRSVCILTTSVKISHADLPLGNTLKRQSNNNGIGIGRDV